MNIVDLLVTIVVVTILVTIILAVVTYIAYKLRLAREPRGVSQQRGPQYFIAFEPEEYDEEDEDAEESAVRTEEYAS